MDLDTNIRANDIDQLQLQLDDLSLRLKQLEDIRLNNGEIMAKDIIYLTNRINDLEYKLIGLRNRNSIADEAVKVKVKSAPEPAYDSTAYDNEVASRVAETATQNQAQAYQNYNYNPITEDYNMPYQRQTQRQMERANRHKKYSISEANVGKYIIGVLAAILMLLAAGVFVGTIWASIPSEFKLIGLALIGAGVQYLGYKKYKGENGFWSSIMGLGSSVVYISIMSGCIIWGLYPDIIFGALAIIWFILNFSLAGKISSKVFYVVTYMGGAVTIILAALKLAAGTYPSVHDQLALGIIIYSIVFLGEYAIHKGHIKNILTLKILNYLFIAFSIAALEGYFAWYTNVKASLAAIIQLSVAFIAMYEASSIKLNTLENTELTVDFYGNPYRKGKIKEIWACVLIHVTLLGVVLGAENLTSAISRTMDFEHFLDFINLGRFLAAMIILLIMAIQSIINKENRERIIMSGATVALVYAGVMSGYMFKDTLIFITLTSLGLYVLYDRGYIKSKAIPYIYTIITILYYHYFAWGVAKRAGNWSLLLNFMIIVAVLGHAYYRSVTTNLDIENRNSLRWVCTKTTLLLLAAFSMTYTISDTFKFEWIHIITIFTALWICHNLYTINKNREYTDSGDRIIALLLCIIVNIALHIMAYIYGIFTDLSLERAEVSIIIISLSCMVIYNSLKFRSMLHTVFVVLVSNFNIIMLANIWESKDTMLVISILGIALSSIFILLGFKAQQKELRILGLISLITYVLKIALIDVSLTHGGAVRTIVMLMIGGVLCYGISFTYNKLDKIYGNESIDTNSPSLTSNSASSDTDDSEAE